MREFCRGGIDASLLYIPEAIKGDTRRSLPLPGAGREASTLGSTTVGKTIFGAAFLIAIFVSSIFVTVFVAADLTVEIPKNSNWPSAKPGGLFGFATCVVLALKQEVHAKRNHV